MFEIKVNDRDEGEHSSAKNGHGVSSKPDKPASAVKVRTVQTIYWNAVPKAVQTAITSDRTFGHPTEVRRDTRTDRTLYHVYFEKGVVTYNAEGQKVTLESVEPPVSQR